MWSNKRACRPVHVLKMSKLERFQELKSLLEKKKNSCEPCDDDPSLSDAIAEYRALKMEHSLARAAEEGRCPKDGGCRFFIARKQRFCSNMASVSNSNGLCIYHQTPSHSGGKPSVDEDPVRNPNLNDADLQDGQSCKGKRKRNMTRCPKHMLNPFKCPSAVASPPWNSIYSDTTLPLLLDIGCAKGRWIDQLASESVIRLELNGQPFNYCGVELYAPLVEMANANILAARRAGSSTTRNLHYISANINTSLHSLAFPNLHTVCIQFPDPWIKKSKRRVVTPAFVMALASVLPSGGQVHSCSLCADFFTISMV